MMSILKKLAKAARINFLTASLIPVLVGTTTAYYDQQVFDPVKFILTLVGIFFIHSSINLANDYYDYLSGNDEKTIQTKFSGGSKAIQQKLFSPKQMLLLSTASLCIGSIVGIYLNHVSEGNTVLAIGVAGILLGIAYTAKPMKLGYRGLGEIACGTGFGPLVVLGTHWVQANTFSATAFAASIPIGILIALVLYINQFPDYEADKAVGKKNLVVLLGKKNSAKLYPVFASLAYLSVLFSQQLGALPKTSLATLLSLPLAAGASETCRKNYEDTPRLLEANKKTVALHIVFGTLLAASLLV